MKWFVAPAWICMFFVSQPENASLLKKCFVSPGEKFLPKLQGALGRARVDFVGAIAHAYDARFPTGAGAAVSGTVSIDQDDSLSGSLKFISDPRAVHTGANHYHIADVLPLGDLHWTKEIRDRTRHQSQFRVGQIGRAHV